MFEAGIHFDVPSAVYFGDPCEQPSLTQSIAKVLIERSPLHAWHEHPRLGGKPTEDAEPEKYEPALAIGNAAHKLMIGRGKDIEVADFDSWRTDKSKEFREAIEKIGKTVILRKHFARALAMVEVAKQRVPLKGGAGEVVIVWQEGDLWFRSMIDWLPDDRHIVTDYKTTGLSCAPHAIPALMLNGGWDVQAAMQERGLNVLFPAEAGRRVHRFIAQENVSPYALTIAELPEDVLMMGRKKLQHAVDLWAECVRAGRWPSYPPGIVYPEYPGWAEAKWLSREIEDAGRNRYPSDRAAENLMAG